MFLDTDPSWSLGVLIGLPIAAIFLLLCLAFLAFALYEGEFGLALGMGGGGAVLILLFTAWTMYPFSAEYHQWRDVAGTVEQIDSRLIGSGDSMEDKFVIRFAESGHQFGCDDTRCAQVREGDHLTLSCKRAWQFTGTDGYDCRFVATEAAR